MGKFASLAQDDHDDDGVWLGDNLDDLLDKDDVDEAGPCNEGAYPPNPKEWYWAQQEQQQKEQQKQEQQDFETEVKNCLLSAPEISDSKSFDFLEIVNGEIKLLDDFSFAQKGRPGLLTSSESYGMAVITRWLNLDGDSYPTDPYPFQKEFPVQPKNSHPNKVLGHVGKMTIPHENRSQIVLLLDPPHLSFEDDSLTSLMQFLSSISNYFFINLQHTDRRVQTLTEPVEKLLKAMKKSRGQKPDGKNPFPVIHLTVHSFSKLSGSLVPSPAKIFDNQFCGGDHLEILFDNLYYKMNGANWDPSLYSERNLSYGDFVKATVVPEQVPSRFYNQLFWNCCAPQNNHLKPLVLTHQDRYIYSLDRYLKYLDVCLERLSPNHPENYVFYPKEGEVGESIYKVVEREVVGRAAEERVKALGNALFEQCKRFLPFNDTSLEAIGENMGDEIVSLLRNDGWTPDELSNFFPPAYRLYQIAPRLKEENQKEKDRIFSQLEKTAKAPPSLTMASDFMEVHKKIYEECRKKMDNGSDWLKDKFCINYKDFLKEMENKFYPDLAEKQMELKEKDDERRIKEERELREEELKRKSAWDKITCRKKRLEDIYRHFWNPSYFQEKVPTCIFAERESNWERTSGTKLWDKSTNGPNGINGENGPNGGHGVSGADGEMGKNGQHGQRAAACMELGKWVELFVTQQGQGDDDFKKTRTVKMIGTALKKDGNGARTLHEPLQINATPQKNEYLRLDFGGGHGGNGGNGGKGGTGGDGTCGIFRFGNGMGGGMEEMGGGRGQGGMGARGGREEMGRAGCLWML